MTREETIAHLEKSIAEQEAMLDAIPAKIEEFKAKEAAALAAEVGRGTALGYLTLTKDDQPSDGLRRMVPTLKDELRRTRAQLAALLAPPPEPGARVVFIPTEEEAEVGRLRGTIASLGECLSDPPDGTTFDRVVRGQWRTSLAFAKGRLRSLVERYPQFADAAVMDDAVTVIPEATRPTREEMMQEPTVRCAVGAPDSPFPPSVERASAPTPARREK